ncbi:MAG TPA: AAA family ATPase [Candidatus Limnocylindrales bacterium]|nr:AAA family ATPase [Candidatus Limnocylindrales bacterium]
MVGETVDAATAVGARPVRILEGEALDPLVQPQCSLQVQLRRATGSIVGRAAELQAIEQAIREAKDHLAAVTLEGEPGIGKTRLLVAAADLAQAAGFITVAITADEEIRGPFLVARSLFGNGAIRDAALGTRAEVPVRRITEALTGRDEPGFENLSPEAKVLRAFDLAGIAIGQLALVRPLALLIDDVQWADDDTLRMLRYAIRSTAGQPIFLFLTYRIDEFATVPEAANLVADMERMGLVRRLRPSRLAATETGLLLKQVLGAPVEGQSVAAMHAQSEGVPFIVEELAMAHREAGTLQQVAGEWTLGRNAARLVPSAVRTLIQRRAARLPTATLGLLGDAGVLGRSFSVRDLVAIGDRGATGIDGAAIAETLEPAVAAGLLFRHPQGDAADYTFTHEQVRDFATSQLSNARRREVHRAVVDLLLEGGEPPAEGLPMLAQHALAAGDDERAARFSIGAAAAALQSNAPEEALRLVDAALPVVSSVADRRALLTTRDDAFGALRRSSDRLDGLAELGALAEASRDRELEVDVQLRRAGALRAGGDDDAAAELARRVQERAAAAGDKAAELRAALELGQALTRVSLGEGFGVSDQEVDLDAAEEPFRRAIELATALGDDRSLAAAEREVGALLVSRVRAWFVEQVHLGRVQAVAQRILSGESIDHIIAEEPIAPVVRETAMHLQKALELFTRLDDRTGVMSTVVLMAYVNYAPTIHLTSSARHLEEIRRVTSRFSELVTESERARQELQMLFGVHVYARAKVVPDLALSRGQEAHRAAKLAGDQSTEFSAAGGVALTYLDLGDIAQAERWLDIAAPVAAATPTPLRNRQLELWRGRVRAGAGDAAGMRRHFEQAGTLAARAGAAGRAEVAGWLAITAARLGSRLADPELLELAEGAAEQASTLTAALPGQPPWSLYADAARAQVALARGDAATAATAGGAAMQALQDALTEDVHLEPLLSAARGILAGAPPEMSAPVTDWLRLTLSRIAQATLDDAVRVRWLRGPLGRELVELAGELETQPQAGPEAGAPAMGTPSPGRSVSGARTSPDEGVGPLDDLDRRIMHLLTEGQTNREMAEALGLTDSELAERLARVLARLGASSRAEATSLAFRGLTPTANLVAATTGAMAPSVSPAP